MPVSIELKHENNKDTAACSSFAQANSVLRRWSSKCHPTHGYDKIDFLITDSEIGLSYQGRYDLLHWRQECADLGNHVVHYLDYISGDARPQHVSVERYQASISHFSAQMRDRAREYRNRIQSILQAEGAERAEPAETTLAPSM